MPTVNVLRIIKLRSPSTTSWPAWVGNHGETMIRKPSTMPSQSSHVRWVPKSRKSDIVDLPAKEAYVSGRRALHSDVQATGPAASGVRLPRRGNQFGACKSSGEQSCTAAEAK